jgi:uridine kinase
MDDYIVDRKNRYGTGNDEWSEYYHLQWDVAWLRENLFNNVKTKHQLNLPMYNDELDTHHTQTISLPAAGVIIIEGVFLQRAEWRGFFDSVVYLDCTREERFRRESEATQKNIEKFRNRYWKAEDYYLMNVCPLKQADWVLTSKES